MITEKQFLEAVDIIKKYQAEVELRLKQIEHNNKTTIQQFIVNYQNGIYNFEMSRRLYNVLCNLYTYHTNYGNNIKYIEDFNKRSFLRMRYAGLKSWIEFSEILETLNIKTNG